MNLLDLVSDFFLFSPQKGFLFTGISFWIFVCIVLGGLSLCYRNRRARNTFLLLCSLFFCYKTGGLFVFILLLSMFLNHGIGKIIERSSDKGSAAWLTVGVLLNLGILAVFKYNVFFTQLWNALWGGGMPAIDYLADGFPLSETSSGRLFPETIERLIPPVGLSFFTLHALSYLIDLKRGHTVSFASAGDFGFYLMFFPKMLAGPIVRTETFMAQMQSHYMLTRQEFSSGLTQILLGLVKAGAVAYFLDTHIVSPVFDNPDLFSGIEKWMALYGFSVWIYCAFSGYTDIVSGLSSLLGFSMPENFHSPYKASSLSDFWRRWHITLHDWFKDYVYIPLGGNRHGQFRMVTALLITMLLAGLWYGAGLGFLLWAALHAAVLCIEKLSRWDAKVERNRWLRLAGWFITFNLISFGWIFFRSGSLQSAADFFFGLFDPTEWSRISVLDYTYGMAFLLLMLVFFCLIFVRERQKKSWMRLLERAPLFVKFLLTALVAVLITLFRL
ncbi:MAG: hypothetical protein NC324_06670 [Bacteroides sp.]|nr:hypothetical protein [Bacteroides sp.]